MACAIGSGLAGTATRTSRTPKALPSVVKAVVAARRGAPIPKHLIPPVATIKLFPQRYRIHPACIGHNRSSRIATPICHVGQRSSAKRLVLFGDSHAFMWLPAVTELGRRDGWDVVPLIRFGCTPGYWIGNVSTCPTWFRWGIRKIRRLHPDVTLLTGSIGDYPTSQTRAEISGTIEGARRLRALGQVVVVGDPEGINEDPVGCALARSASMATCTTRWPPSSLAAYWDVARGVTRLGVGFLPTRGFTCYQGQCPAVVDHMFVWMDQSHLTGVYSAALAGPFREAFLRARPKPKRP
jgi:hypothetical protein